MMTVRVWIKEKDDSEPLELEKNIGGNLSEPDLIDIKGGLEVMYKLGMIKGYHVEIDRGIL
jgi:hypothetical protein